MCGIVGYVGERQTSNILLEGLTKLEYRGYDSAGITVLNQVGQLETRKCKGRLSNLVERLREQGIQGTMGIGHTRWATHGEPSDVNSHPHTNQKESVSVVHNGIIENYLYLKEWLIKKGYQFLSQTDTEVIPNLIDYYYKGDLLEAVMKAVSKMEGSFALGVICRHEPDKIVAVRKDSPLIAGIGEDGFFIASDVPAILNQTRKIYYLKDREYAVLTKGAISFYSPDGEPIEKEVKIIDWNADAAEKGGFEHFMLKEIHEQPKGIKDTMMGKIAVGKPVTLDEITITKEELAQIDRIFIVACGTAYHAGIVGKYVIEKLARIPVEVDIASEFRYRDPIITDKTLMIVISQSGETADTLAALREAKKKGSRVIAITNVVGSSVAREAKEVIYTSAGPEIAVASTKAYTTQLITLYTLALYLCELKGTLPAEELDALKKEMLSLPEKTEQVLELKEILQKFASQNFMHKDMFYLGRGLDYAVAIEGALKLKEISYIHTESYAGGELKHGTIALIEDGTVVIAMVTQEALKEKMLSNIKEVTTRGAKVLAFVQEGTNELDGEVASVVRIPKVADIFAPVLSVVPLQLFSYYVAVQRGCDVDKPRNLAKSVTVE